MFDSMFENLKSEIMSAASDYGCGGDSWELDRLQEEMDGIKGRLWDALDEGEISMDEFESLYDRMEDAGYGNFDDREY